MGTFNKTLILTSMKKIIFSLLCVAVSMGTFAQNQEVGLVVGGFNGLSYKKMMSENFAIQTDLAIGFQRTIIDVGHNALGNILYGYDLFDFVINPNFLYNKELKHGIYVFAGGGASVGLAQELYEGYSADRSGKFGVNGMIGAGYKLADLPLTFALDFRPGYAMLPLIRHKKIIHAFDWHLAASLRYCF